MSKRVDEFTLYLFISARRENGKIPTGFIVAGPSRAADANLFESIADYLKSKERISMVILDSMQTPNLKSALKCINGCATPLDQNLIDDEDIDSRRKVSDLVS